jgi:hypothetical protein
MKSSYAMNYGMKKIFGMIDIKEDGVKFYPLLFRVKSADAGKFKKISMIKNTARITG